MKRTKFSFYSLSLLISFFHSCKHHIFLDGIEFFKMNVPNVKEFVCVCILPKTRQNKTNLIISLQQFYIPMTMFDCVSVSLCFAVLILCSLLL
jgi:hypothetical protein